MKLEKPYKVDSKFGLNPWSDREERGFIYITSSWLIIKFVNKVAD